MAHVVGCATFLSCIYLALLLNLSRIYFVLESFLCDCNAVCEVDVLNVFLFFCSFIIYFVKLINHAN